MVKSMELIRSILDSFYTVTSRCVRRSVMSANKFYRSLVSACGHNGTTGTFPFVHCSVMSAKNFYRSVVSACGHNGTTGTSRCVRRSVMSAKNFYRSLCPHANIMEKPLCPVMFMLGWSRFLQQYYIIYTYIGTIFNSLYVS